MSESDVSGPSAPVLMAVFDELLESWQDRIDTGEHRLSSRQKKTLPQAAVVLALSSHVYESAKFLRPHLPKGLTAVHAPIVRGVLETAMTVIWVDKVEDASSAFLNEEVRQRTNLRNTMRETPWFAEHADKIAHVDDEMHETSAAEEAKRFHRLLQRIGAEQFYAVYRLLCGVTHPSVTLTDCYLEALPSAKVAFSLKPYGEPLLASESHSWLMAVCLLWTARTVNYYDSDHQRRSQLRRLGQEIGVKVDFRLP